MATAFPKLRTVFLDHLNSPFGVALVGHDLYVANTDAIVRYPYQDGQTSITAPGTKLTDLPGGPIDHHWTKALLASPDGSKLYVGVGSNSNITENGIGAEYERAAIWEVDRASGAHRIFASGIRNPTGLQWEPETGKLWAIANERDEIGPDLVPDYLTSVRDGGFYGWPYSYYGQHLDPTRRTAAARSGGLQRSRRTMRLAPTWRRWVWPCTPAPIFPQTTAAERSSANTEAGIERLLTATRLSSCPSATDGRAARRRMSLPASSMRTITRAEGRLVWQSTEAADC